MQDFIIFEDYGEVLAQMSALFQVGTIKFREDIVVGLAGCGKRPPAAFWHHSEALSTYGIEYASPLRSLRPCGQPFAYPTWLFSVVSKLGISDGYRGQNEFFRSLLEKASQASSACWKARSSARCWARSYYRCAA